MLREAVGLEAGSTGKNASAATAPVTEKEGDRIGRYKLLEQIGEGGMGVVYMAEQEEPVRRRVALKVIKLGMDTRSGRQQPFRPAHCYNGGCSRNRLCRGLLLQRPRGWLPKRAGAA